MVYRDLVLKCAEGGVVVNHARIDRATELGFMPPTKLDGSGRKIYLVEHVKGLTRYHRAIANGERRLGRPRKAATA
jgi:hypothetical protein